MPLGYNNDDGAQALDQQQEIDFRRGWQVVDAASGSNVVTDGTGTYEVDVAAGDINTPAGTVTCSAATLDLQSLVDPDLPRIVLVYRDASGVAQTLAGTPAAKQPTGETAPGPIYQPAPDAFSTTDGVVLATVLLEAAASSVGSGQIRDRRMPASLNVDSAEFGSVNTDREFVAESTLTATLSANQSTPSGTNTVVQFDGTDEDDPNLSLDTATGEITVQTAGMYLIDGGVRFDSDSGWTTGDQVTVFPKLNGTIQTFNVLNKVSTDPQTFPVLPFRVDAAESDVISLSVNQKSGASQSVVGGGKDTSLFTVSKIA